MRRDYMLGRIGRGPGGMKAFAEGSAARVPARFRDARGIHATCEDYRAAATH